MKTETQSIINDLDFIINELKSCTYILQRNKGIGSEKCIESLNDRVVKYSKIRRKIKEL